MLKAFRAVAFRGIRKMTNTNLDKFNDRKTNQAIYFLFITVFFFLTPLHFQNQGFEFTSALYVAFSSVSAISSIALFVTLYQILQANSE